MQTQTEIVKNVKEMIRDCKKRIRQYELEEILKRKQIKKRLLTNMGMYDIVDDIVYISRARGCQQELYIMITWLEGLIQK